MTPIKFHLTFCKCFDYFLNGAICLFFVFVITSCHKKAATGYSEAFKPVFDTVSVLFGTNRLDFGIHYLDSSLNRINNPTPDDRFRAYAFHYVYEAKAKGDNHKALLYTDSMLNMANQNINDEQYIANFTEAQFVMGDTYFSLQKYNDAYLHFYQGYQAGKANFNNKALADYNYRMGMILYKMENFNLAANYFKKSYGFHAKTNEDFGEFYRKQELLDNIALSLKHKEIDSAIVYYDKALAFIDEYGPQFKDRLKMIDIARGVVYGNKAEVLILKGRYAEATTLLQKSIAINLKKGYDYSDAEATESKLAKLYYDHHDDAALFNLLNNMRRQLDSVKNQNAESEWSRLMSNYYLRKKQYPEAFRYLQTYNSLKDSGSKKLRLLQESDINRQFDTYEKQRQIDELSNKNKYQKIYLFVITIIAGMTFIIVFLVYRNWRTSKDDILKVNTLNGQINEQNIVLENALKELKVSSQEKDRILRTVAHDLRNPLGGIAALTATMADDEFSDEQKEQINLVKETSVNALELINEILEATNIASVQLKLELVDINLLVHNSIELLRFKAAEKGQQIFFKPLARHQELYINREKIWRVISNLVSNAIKFSPAGTLIFVNVTKEQEQVVIAVEDNGIGIPAELGDQVFNMFTAAQRPGTAGEKSFGLGLSICKQIMDKFNGKIWFERKEKGGTVFFISLPVSSGAAVPDESPQKTGIPVAG